MARPSGHGTGFETRRQEIIDTAAALFARRGYAGTASRRSARQSDSARALYYYIGSKENLLVGIQGRVLRPLLRSARRFDKLGYRYLQGENLSLLLRQRREFEAIVRRLLESGMETGALGQMDSQLAVLQFLNLHNPTYQWVTRTGHGTRRASRRSTAPR